MNQILCVVTLCLLFGTLRAQEPLFLQRDIGDANVGIAINTLLQDHQSMIWLGMKNGLSRYDGYEWHEVIMDSASHPVEVTALFEDDAGKIWVGTSAGKIFYLDRARKAHVFDIEEGHPSKPITSILQDKNNQVWFATYGEGVYVYNGTRLYNLGVDDGLSGRDIYAMASTPSGEIWLGTDDGINICTFRNEQKQIRQLGLAEGLPDQIITALKTDQKGNVWIGTFENGVVFYDASLRKIVTPFESPPLDEVTAIEIFDDTELWIGTRKSGLWRYHPDTKFVRRIVQITDMKPGEISDLVADVEGNIWVSTIEGILLSAFRPFESLAIEIGEVETIFCDYKDQVWLGTQKGLYRILENKDEISSTVRVAPQYDFNITDIIEDTFHNLWIGTLDNGLYIYDPVSGKVRHLQEEEIAGTTVMSIACTKKDIWIATLQGVISYPTTKNILNDRNVDFQLVSDPWQSNLHFVFQIFVDSKDRAWFATDGNGVYSIDGNKVTQHTGKDSLVIKTVYSICEDHSGHLWFNTPDHGLIEFDGETYKPLGIKEGLGNPSIAAIAVTGAGDILITHKRGIDLMEPARRHFMYYMDEVGVKSMDPGLNSISTNSRGHVFVSGPDQVIKYYSAKRRLSIHPRTQITSVSIYEQPIDYTTEHHFAYDENYISFDYVGLWYSSPKSVNYLYMLDGYDRQWKESRDNAASYSSLPPGDYTFYVKASENKFFLDEPLASYSFTISKPFWMQYWFMATVLILSGFLFYVIIKSRERRSERQAVLKKEMIESQLQALKAQINPHFLFNSFNTLITIIDENSRQPGIAIEYVEKLSDFFRSILQYREQETITLQEEWDLVQNFCYLLKKRYDNNLRLNMDKPPKDAYILPLTLQMLVENAVKHNIISDRKPLDINITIDDDEYVTVQNNLQPKSKTEPSTQFGLQSIIKRYHLLSEKKVIIEKDEHFFRVRIPIIKQPTE